MSERTILLLDSDSRFRKEGEEHCSKAGYHCLAVSNFKEAYGILQTQDVMLVVAEYHWPNFRFADLLEVTHTHKHYVPFIAVTRFPTVEDSVAAFRMGVCDYFVRPVEWPTLMTRINAEIERSELLNKYQKIVENLQTWQQTIMALQLGQRGVNTSVDYPRLMLAQMADTLLQLGEVPEPSTSEQKRPICKFYACPKLAAYEDALAKTRDVLEKTKTAFKSKDLGQLREDLEFLLKNPPAVPFITVRN